MDKTFQVAVSAPIRSANALEQLLHELELAHPPLLRLSVQRRDDRLSLFLDFDTELAFELHRPRLELAMEELEAQAMALSEAGDEQRDQLLEAARRGRLSSDVASAFRAVVPAAPHLTLDFPSDAALLSTWARYVAEGALWVPGSFHGQTVALTIQTPERRLLGNLGHRVDRPRTGGVPGVWLELSPGPALERLLETLSQERARTRRPKVLVVDDEAIWRQSLARMLRDLGVDVELASDGHQGLLTLIDRYFELDLVLLDLHMPELDGRGLIERVRRLGGEHALRIFLFSAAGKDELDELRAPGKATAVFSKLEPLEQLQHALQAELGLSGPTLSRAA